MGPLPSEAAGTAAAAPLQGRQLERRTEFRHSLTHSVSSEFPTRMKQPSLTAPCPTGMKQEA